MIPNIDFEKVKQKLIFVENTIGKLENLRKLSLEEFLGDFRNVDSAKYLLQVAIEGMIDISSHIIARNRWGNPETNRECFQIIADKNLIGKDNVETYFSMAKFRNRIVHMYYNIDDSVIYEIVQNNIKDLKQFVKDIGENL